MMVNNVYQEVKACAFVAFSLRVRHFGDTSVEIQLA